MGRKKVKDNERKSIQVNFRITIDQQRELERISRDYNLPKTELLRYGLNYILEGLGR